MPIPDWLNPVPDQPDVSPPPAAALPSPKPPKWLDVSAVPPEPRVRTRSIPPSPPTRLSVRSLGAPENFGEQVYLRSPGALVEAIGAAEGVPSFGTEDTAAKYGGDHRLVPVEEGRASAARTVHATYKQWLAAGKPGDYLDYLADHYAPMEGDTSGLNANWTRNVYSALSGAPNPQPSRHAPTRVVRDTSRLMSAIGQTGFFNLADPRGIDTTGLPTRVPRGQVTPRLMAAESAGGKPQEAPRPRSSADLAGAVRTGPGTAFPALPAGVRPAQPVIRQVWESPEAKVLTGRLDPNSPEGRRAMQEFGEQWFGGGTPMHAVGASVPLTETAGRLAGQAVRRVTKPIGEAVGQAVTRLLPKRPPIEPTVPLSPARQVPGTGAMMTPQGVRQTREQVWNRALNSGLNPNVLDDVRSTLSPSHGGTEASRIVEANRMIDNLGRRGEVPLRESVMPPTAEPGELTLNQRIAKLADLMQKPGQPLVLAHELKMQLLAEAQTSGKTLEQMLEEKAQGIGITPRKVGIIPLTRVGEPTAPTPDAPLSIERMATSPNPTVRNMALAVRTIAPRFAGLQDRIQQGLALPMDISANIVEAMNKLSDLRGSGIPVRLYLDQQVASGTRELSPEAKRILAFVDSTKGSKQKLQTMLLNFADRVEALGDPAQAGLLGPRTVPTKDELLDMAMRATGVKVEVPPASRPQPRIPVPEKPTITRGTEPRRLTDPHGVLQYLSSESGAVNVGKPIEEIRQFLAETQRTTQIAGTLDDRLYQMTRQREADAIRARQLLQRTPLSPGDAEALYHWREDRRIPLTARQAEIHQTVLQPIRAENQRIKAKLQPRLAGIVNLAEEFTERFAKEHGGILDRMIEGVRGTPAGGLLSKGGPVKHRVMKVLVGEDGSRVVAAIKDGHVYKFEGGKPVDLGAFRLTTKEDLMDKTLKPIERKMTAVEKEIQTLASVKSFTPTKMQTLTNELQTISADLMDTAVRYDPQEQARLRARARAISHDLQVLRGTQADQRLLARRVATLQDHLSGLRQSAADILARYDPNDLSRRVFTGKDGQRYRIAEATTKEIEAQTAVRYHKHVLANDLVTYTRLRAAERASDFLEAFKTAPEFSSIAMRADQPGVPKHWVGVKFPQFIGYKFEHHVAATLDKYAKSLGAGANAEGALEKVNRFLRTAIFFNPLIHIPNITIHWLVNRGLTPFLNPAEYPRLARTMTKAWRAVLSQNDDYLMMLDHGAPLKAAENYNRQLTKLIVEKMGKELEEHPNMAMEAAEALGMAPMNLVKKIYQFSGDATWITNDIATMQAIYEEMEKGLPIQHAIAEVGKHIPNYRVPGHILGQRWIADVMTNPSLTMFGPYHYGALWSYGEMAKDLVKGDLRQKAAVADKLAMMGLIGLVVYPTADKLLQKATGDPRTRIRRAGAITFPYNLYRYRTGQLQPLYLVESVATPAPLPGFALRQVMSPSGVVSVSSDPTLTPAEKATRIAGQGVSAIAPLALGEKVFGGDDPLSKRIQDAAWSLAGVTTPKKFPSESRVNDILYNRRWQRSSEAMKLYAAGKTPEGARVVARYNQALRDAYIQEIRDETGKPPTSDQVERWMRHAGHRLMPPAQQEVEQYRRNQPVLQGQRPTQHGRPVRKGPTVYSTPSAPSIPSGLPPWLNPAPQDTPPSSVPSWLEAPGGNTR